LLHDDIIDGSDSRRGQDSAFRKYGLAQTLVTGDFLFGRAYQLCARFDEHLIGWAVDASIRLTEGEIMQGRFRRNPAVTFADYLEIVARKTAALFQQGARTAAAMAHAPAEIVNAISRADCASASRSRSSAICDVLGDEALTETGSLDLREKSSLPIVLRCSTTRNKRLFQRADLADSDIAWLLNRLRRSTVLQQGRTLATERLPRTRRSTSSPTLPTKFALAHRRAARPRIVGVIAVTVERAALARTRNRSDSGARPPPAHRRSSYGRWLRSERTALRQSAIRRHRPRPRSRSSTRHAGIRLALLADTLHGVRYCGEAALLPGAFARPQSSGKGARANANHLFHHAIVNNHRAEHS
jgi:hypothetical protein